MGGKLAGRRVWGGAGMWEVAVERRPQNVSMGTWTLGAKGGRGWALEGVFLGGGGGLRGLDAKGPRPMHPDAACGVRMHCRRPLHFWTEWTRGDAPRTRVYVISAWNVRRTGWAGRDGAQDDFFCWCSKGKSTNLSLLSTLIVFLPPSKSMLLSIVDPWHLLHPDPYHCFPITICSNYTGTVTKELLVFDEWCQKRGCCGEENRVSCRNQKMGKWGVTRSYDMWWKWPDDIGTTPELVVLVFFT